MESLLVDFNNNEEFISAHKGNSLYYDTNNEKVYGLPAFNRIHLFVGQNNSGKSKFLRGLLKSPTYKTINDKTTHKYNSAIKLIDNLCIEINKSDIKPQFQIYSISNEFRSLANSKVFEFFTFNTATDGLSHSSKLLHELKTNCFASNREHKHAAILIFLKFLIYTIDYQPNARSQQTSNIDECLFVYTIGLSYVLQNFRNELSNLISAIEELKDAAYNTITTNQKVYIPTLRTTHSIFDDGSPGYPRINRDIFHSSIEINYKFDLEKHLDKQNITIHTGLNLYENIKNTENGFYHEMDSHKAFVDFVRVHFFPDYDELTIWSVIKKNDADRNINVRFGKEEGKPIHHLGDGISSLINILYPIFTCQDNTWFFLEEPELHLHPGLQRIFVEELINNELIQKKNLRFFITTHSNHILDIGSATSDVSIYTFSKIRENHHVIKLAKSGDVSILNDLGVQNSSVYLSNCTIWVEGVTDRIYLSSYLKCYLQEKAKKGKVKYFDEDIHYSFFLYGGSNIVHYLFTENESEFDQEQLNEIKQIRSKFLSNRILLIADSDKGKEAKHNLLDKQQNDFFTYVRLPVREIENLLSIEFLLENLSQVTKSVSVSDLNKLKLEPSKLKTEYLGMYIVSSAAKAGIKFPKSFMYSSGTVNPVTYKKALAEIAYHNMTWELMTKEARDLADRIYKFIESNNSLR